jgi:hypothetical protein
MGVKKVDQEIGLGAGYTMYIWYTYMRPEVGEEKTANFAADLKRCLFTPWEANCAPTVVSPLQQNLISVQIIGTWPVQIIEALRSQKLEDLQFLF